MGASGSLIEPPSQPVVKIVEAIYKANCNIKMNSIMIPHPLSYDSTCSFRAWVNALILPITLYLFAVSFIFLTNAFLLGTYKHAFGHAGYTLLTAVGLAGFLYVFRKDRRDLAATLILYLLLNVPGAMMYWDADSNVRDVFDLPRSLTKNNCCAISLAVLIMFFTASSCFFQNRFVQRLIRLVSAVLWGAAVSLPLAFIAYWLSHDGLMNADTLIAIWQTNPSEAVEYFSYKGAMFTVGVCITEPKALESMREFAQRKARKSGAENEPARLPEYGSVLIETNPGQVCSPEAPSEHMRKPASSQCLHDSRLQNIHMPATAVRL